MWNRYHWLKARVRIRKGKSRFWMPPVFLSAGTMRRALLSADGLLGLIPSWPGRAARGGADSLQRVILALQEEGLDVEVNLQKADETVRVRVGMV